MEKRDVQRDRDYFDIPVVGTPVTVTVCGFMSRFI